MQIREITVTYGGKLNLGDYNSAHVELTATALLDDDEHLDEVAGQLFQQIKAEVRTQVRELMGKRGARVDEIFAGLPNDANHWINRPPGELPADRDLAQGRAIGSHALEPGELLAMFPHSWRDCKVPGLCATCKAAATLIGSANAGRGAVVADYRALFPDELDYAKAQRAVAFSRLRYAADNRTRRILRAALVWWRSEVGRMEKETMKPTIVCLCGSTRFYDQFQRAYYGETMAGKIVLSVGFMPDSAEHGEHIGITPAQKEALDVLHLEKVKMADEVLILNVGGYIGQSTARELAYALELGKSVRFLEETGL